MKTTDVLDRIAPSKILFEKSKAQWVEFSDGSSGPYRGYVERSRPNSVDFVWDEKPMTVNKHGVLCYRSKQPNGKTWYSYTLEPFGKMVYSEEVAVGSGLLSRYRKNKPPASA